MVDFPLVEAARGTNALDAGVFRSRRESAYVMAM
jgi:hypothetical protein